MQHARLGLATLHAEEGKRDREGDSIEISFSFLQVRELARESERERESMRCKKAAQGIFGGSCCRCRGLLRKALFTSQRGDSIQLENVRAVERIGKARGSKRKRITVLTKSEKSERSS